MFFIGCVEPCQNFHLEDLNGSGSPRHIVVVVHPIYNHFLESYRSNFRCLPRRQNFEALVTSYCSIIDRAPLPNFDLLEF